MYSLDFSPTIICVIEIRIKDQPLINISLPGYNLVHVNSNSSAGGVAAYSTYQMQINSMQNANKTKANKFLENFAA